MTKKINTTDRQKVFSLPTTPPERLRLRREHTPSYDAGAIDAYLNVLKKIGVSRDLCLETLQFTESQARNLCFQQLSYALSELRKAKSKIAVQKRLLGEIRQTHFDF